MGDEIQNLIKEYDSVYNEIKRKVKKLARD